MLVVCDCETNGLKPTRIWVIVCREVVSGKVHTFTNPDTEPQEFLRYAQNVTGWIGHNFLSYDLRVINRLVGPGAIRADAVIDTLVVGRLTDFFRPSHSLESYGEELRIPKVIHNDWEKLTPEMIHRCTVDTEINLHLYQKQLRFIQSPLWKRPLRLEHDTAIICNEIQDNGFYFDTETAATLHAELSDIVGKLDRDLVSSFSPKCKLIREVHPKATKFGTLNRQDFRWLLADGPADLSDYSPDAPFSRIAFHPFNPTSPSQIVERLNIAGWNPTEKTKGHFLAEQQYKKRKTRENEDRLAEFAVTGWKVSEKNLSTLADTAPPAAHSLVRFLVLNNRLKLLSTLIESTGPDHRLHPSFNSLGTWTGRKSHSDPNVANIPTAKPQDTPEFKSVNNRIRGLFTVPKDRLLVGVDADSIQLRVLAHYMDDKRFIEALVSGDKEKGTDVHSLNVTAIGPACQGRRDAKTFIYAWLLGAGVDRIAEILGTGTSSARDARERFLSYYPGLQRLKEEDIPNDAIRGYFQGFDGRYVQIYGEDESQRQHYCLGGYLQNGESVVMKTATLIWHRRLKAENIPFWQVNDVHDEWQTETINDLDVAKYIGEVQADSIRQAGELLNLRCPMKGSVLNAHDKLAVGTDWRDTH